MSNSGEVDVGDCTPRTAHRLALRLRPGHAQLDSFSDDASLVLGHSAQQVQLQPTGGCRGVDALVQADERHAKSRKLIEEKDEVPKVAAEAVEFPDDERVEATATGVLRDIRSRAGRDSFAPLTPVSAYSVASHPRASQNRRNSSR